MKKTRGRPRKFDEAVVLQAATGVFWQKGLSGTSLDDLAAAMEMNRPSIYSAFGDKQSLYRQALARFCGKMSQSMADTMLAEREIGKAMRAFYHAAVDVYTTGESPLGCMVMSTATCAAPTHPEVLADLRATLRAIDGSFRRRFEKAVEDGQLEAGFESSLRAKIAQAILHTLSVRARAGESKASLNKLVRSSVDLLLS